MKIHTRALYLGLVLLRSVEHSNADSVDDLHLKPTFHFNEDNEEANTTRYIVRFKKGSKEYASRMNTAQRYPSTQTSLDPLFTYGSFLPEDDAEVMILSNTEEVKMWESKEDVESVELDHKVYLQAESTPYGIDKVQALSVSDSLVSNRKVCIIDSGYDMGHEDLSSNTNVVTGYSGGDSAGPWNVDGHGHGTHVAGTIAAIGNNGKGVIGVTRSGSLKLHIVRVFGDNGYWAWGSTLVAAVEECVSAGSNIVSMSLGGGGFTDFENDTYERIFNEGTLLIAAAGNGSNSAYSYPASYDSVVSVAATDSNNDVASFSQHNDQVDIAAPGVAVSSTLPGNTYAAWSGTSMATPHVSGVAALVWSLDTSLSASAVRNILYATAQDLGSPGRDNYYGHGLVRADLAAQYLDGDLTFSPTASPTAAPPCEDDPIGWHDSDGPFYDCAWYGEGNNCANFGDNYENDGKTANQACCVCGGGKVPDTESPTSPPSATPVGDCPSGEKLFELLVITDANGAADNKYKIHKKVENKFSERVWLEKDFTNSSTATYEVCLPANECYKGWMIDTAEDGMCCENGQGGFKVTWDGTVLSDFTTDQKVFFNGRKRSTSPFGDSC